MKHGMKKRKTLGKISKYLRTVRAGRSKHSETRNIVRGSNRVPSSTKVGAGGGMNVRRSLPNQILHKRNHRSNAIVQGPIQDK